VICTLHSDGSATIATIQMEHAISRVYLPVSSYAMLLVNLAGYLLNICISYCVISVQNIMIFASY